MKRNFSKKLGRSYKLFVGLNKHCIPYCGVKRIGKKSSSQSFTFSPTRKTIYTKNKTKSLNLRTKTNIGSFIPKIKLSKIKKKRHY